MALGPMKKQEDRERNEDSALLSCFLLQYSNCTSLFSFQKIYFFLFYVCVRVPAYLCVGHSCVWGHRGQNEVLEPLELELQAVVRCLVSPGN